jgi:HK97 family phage portal protein
MGGPQSYLQFARKGYMGNEIVFAGLELLGMSASEPHIIGQRWRRESPRFGGMRDREEFRHCIRRQMNHQMARGLPFSTAYHSLIRNGFVIEVPNHPLIKLLNAPNPYMSRGQCWAMVTVDYHLAGNAYLLKARNVGLGNVQELWRLQPDRVRIIPDKETFCKYEYRVGQEVVTFEYRDVMHFKTRNPIDPYYGMPPLLPVMGRLDIDAYMRGFLQTFFERGGTGPGSILSVKQKLSDEAKNNIRDRFHRQFGGFGGFHEMMILDQAETSYQQMGLNRGLRDALPKEIDAMQEARIGMVLGIPGSIIGMRIGYESSSYANKRQDWQVFWDLKMAPFLSELADVLNLSLVPEFGGIDEVLFDKSDIKALQEDVDAIQDRARKNFVAGGWSLQEFRDATGKDPEALDGIFYVPANIYPMKGANLDGGQLQPPEPAQMLRALLAPPQLQAATIVGEVHCPSCGRWLGRNMNVGATAHCPKCSKEVEVVS